MSPIVVDRHTSPIPAAPVWRWPLVLTCALLVIGWQIWTVADRRPSTFLISYWFVTWDHGFIRRGLLGEINQYLFGDDRLFGAHVLLWTCGAIAAACAAVVSLGLLRRGTPAMTGLGWLILLSPYLIKGLLTWARPDQLSFPLILLTAWALSRRPRRPMMLLITIGAVFAVLVLAHEGVVLTTGPWLLLVIVWFTRDLGLRQLIHRTLSCFALPALVTCVVAWRGAATPRQVELLTADAAGVLPSGENMIQYLADSTADSVAVVADFGAANLVSMAVVGTVLVALHLIALASIPGLGLRPPRIVTVVLLTVVLPAFVLQLAVAKDWQRWFGVWVAMGLLCLGTVLLTDRAAARAVGSAHWRPRSLVVFVIVVALIFGVPRASANTRYPCTITFIPHEAPFPYQRAADVLTGTQHDYDYLGGCRLR